MCLKTNKFSCFSSFSLLRMFPHWMRSVWPFFWQCWQSVDQYSNLELVYFRDVAQLAPMSVKVVAMCMKKISWKSQSLPVGVVIKLQTIGLLCKKTHDIPLYQTWTKHNVIMINKIIYNYKDKLPRTSHFLYIQHT